MFTPSANCLPTICRPPHGSGHLRRDLGERLQRAESDRRWFTGDDCRRVREPFCGLILTFGGDHLRVPFALGFSLARHLSCSLSVS